ncbi:hypothetical protein GLW08_18200 [Pontibacillus yanchengensis]|uniref:Uncharacterized protein n=2 Tax=Pontibacillus yanchengensis TaxID=462910 RepID=A0ACC7VM03_9BACI|nr:glutaredoxin domain-containing protein [Pontibacillus yanchengensis]MYL35030.1 hypothetical protein [Pontibacillus yanchengensis]MYL55259.1 hypothetical protein [Pontibacillus yanchengensis]
MNLLYTMDGCKNCFKAKKHLQDLNISFEEVNILQEPNSHQRLKELVGEVYAPVYVTDQDVFKGLDILNYDTKNLR